MSNATVSESAITQPFRLSRGGLIDRSSPMAFTFDHRVMRGYAGDTLASALLANGERVVGRSFKYHRRRGILTAGSEEPNALVELRRGARREPNTKATTIELFEGLSAGSQNCWPSLGFDLMAANGLFSSVFVAGFYYKTFMWPASFWERLYEPVIRRAAGLGRASGEPDPDRYDKAHAFCDVLVVGSGPAGLMAALMAGRSGARVILCEEDFRFGGRLLSEQMEIDSKPAAAWAAEAVAELSVMPEVRLMPRTTVFGVYDGRTYGALERANDNLACPPKHRPRQRLWEIVAKRCVLASGAIERPIVFPGNDRPGVMMASSLRTYANRFGVLPGRRVALFTCNDSGWHAAADLVAVGAEVAAVVDSREAVAPDAMMAVERVGVPIILGGRVIGTRGRFTLKEIEVESRAGSKRLDVDALGVSGGWDPALGLACHLGGKSVWRDDIATFVPDRLPEGMDAAGAAKGTLALSGALAEGAAAGAGAAAAVGFKPPVPSRSRCSDEKYGVSPLWHVVGKEKAFVDFQHDVTAKDIGLAHREGFHSVEHLKRYTTLGMGTDQGRTANVNAAGMMAALTGRSIAETGTTRFRPPYVPVAVGAFAGRHRGKEYRPTRHTPSHQWAEEQGAKFVEIGPWLRAQYFPRVEEGDDWLRVVSREVAAVRSGAGVCDVSTLGKIDIQGPDAGVFLDRVYINTFSTLAVGRVRYGLMLREDGIALDDGTTARLDKNHFFMTTSTAGAARVMQHLEFCHQVLWPELDLQLVSVTDQWAQYAITGPNARTVVSAAIDARHDLSNDALPYLGVAEVTLVGGVRARLFRISFSGELGYELSVPARYGDAVIRRLIEIGTRHGLTPYGTEALSVMRIEKGHPAGNEINGQTTARDLGLARMMSRKKDFIGRVLAARAALTDPERPTLVGLKPCEHTRRLHAGAHFLSLGRRATGENDQGYMTSVAFSPTLGHWIGLGFLTRGEERLGERVRAFDPVRGGDIKVEVCPAAFIDPSGERLRA